jgi:pyruvate dehydrogenase E1 component alpha subunit/2-oxoisovalerate dehydrogenase E1 component alpha subunit
MGTEARKAPAAPAPEAAATGKPLRVDYPPTPHVMPATALDAKRERPLDATGGLSVAQLEELYRYLFLTRRLEEVLVALYRQNQVVGGVYRSLGQEATAVGCTYAMSRDDFVQPLIRDLGAALTHGVAPIAVLRQYMARATGPTAGRDLNVHMSCPSRGLVGPVSMLGAAVPVLVGCLLAARLRKEPRAGLTFIGDGGTSTGAFYEGVNFAAVQRLPLVVVVEANQFAYSTPTRAQLPHGDLLCRARGFGVHVTELDGNDIVACAEATGEARWRGLQGEGPTLLVAHTYRRKGHAEHDSQSYVERAELEAWTQHNDPVSRYEAFLSSGGHVSPARQEALRAEINEVLTAARAHAVDDPLPDRRAQPLGEFTGDAGIFPPVDTWLGEGARGRPARGARCAS